MTVNALEMLSVRNVTDLYADAVNRSHAADIADTFADDAVWELTGAFTIKTAGARVIADTILSAQKSMEYVMQVIGSIVVEFITGDTAVTRCSLVEFGRIKESGRAMTCCVYYRDELVRQAGTWRFKHRFGQVNYWNEYEFKGMVVPFVPPAAG